MILLTTNTAKFEPFANELANLGICLVRPNEILFEFQGETIEQCSKFKALWAARNVGHEVMVDDAGLLLAAHPGFPGPMTGIAVRTLGLDAWKALVASDNRAEMVCVLAWSDGQSVQSWEGRANGYLDFSRPIMPDRPGPLSSWFQCSEGPLEHRRKALSVMQQTMGAL
jgi:inosine/xanthosine triphosphate pyrophosphatase family protein